MFLVLSCSLLTPPLVHPPTRTQKLPFHFYKVGGYSDWRVSAFFFRCVANIFAKYLPTCGQSTAGMTNVSCVGIVEIKHIMKRACTRNVNYHSCFRSSVFTHSDRCQLSIFVQINFHKRGSLLEYLKNARQYRTWSKNY